MKEQKRIEEESNDGSLPLFEERLEVDPKGENMEDEAKEKQPGLDWNQVTDYSEGLFEGKIRR